MARFKKNEMGPTRVVEKHTKVIEKQSVDLESMEKIIQEAFERNIDKISNRSYGGSTNNIDKVDDFDDSNSLKKLADAMTVQRNEKKSNIKDIGNVEYSEKDKDKLEKTRDLLKGLD
jgi:hypothetical protein